jgi:hypothetical protein
MRRNDVARKIDWKFSKKGRATGETTSRRGAKHLKSAAVLTIASPGEMTPAGRRAIAKWLRAHADMLIKFGDEYTTGRFIGRYMYEEKRRGA